MHAQVRDSRCTWKYHLSLFYSSINYFKLFYIQGLKIKSPFYNVFHFVALLRISTNLPSIHCQVTMWRIKKNWNFWDIFHYSPRVYINTTVDSSKPDESSSRLYFFYALLFFCVSYPTQQLCPSHHQGNYLLLPSLPLLYFCVCSLVELRRTTSCALIKVILP